MVPAIKRPNLATESKHPFRVLAKKMGLDEVSIPFQWLWKIVAVVFAGGMAWATLYNNVSGLKAKHADLESTQQSQAIQIYAMHDDVNAIKNQLNVMQYKLDQALAQSNPTSQPKAVSSSPMASAPAPSMSTYEVQGGESLWDVAKKLNVSTENLIRNNPNLLQPGAKFGQGLILSYEKPA